MNILLLGMKIWEQLWWSVIWKQELLNSSVALLQYLHIKTIQVTKCIHIQAIEVSKRMYGGLRHTLWLKRVGNCNSLVIIINTLTKSSISKSSEYASRNLKSWLLWRVIQNLEMNLIVSSRTWVSRIYT